MSRVVACLALAGVLLTAGCTGAATSRTPTAPTGSASTGSDSPQQVDRPHVGTCRRLSTQDVNQPVNASPGVPCSSSHTAETFHVGTFRGKLAKAAVDDDRLGAEVFRQCDRRFRRYVGADESLALRTVLSWAWFRPTSAEWDAGARWYRCDVVASNSPTLLPLTRSTRGVLLGRPHDRWLLCARGSVVATADRVACSEPHTWRAVTTVVLGTKKDPYPGDRRVEVQTRDFCSDSVGAWLGYPVDYQYGYTWLHKAEWDAGNRRSVCWAKDQ